MTRRRSETTAPRGPALLFADTDGTLYDHPTLEAVVLSGTERRPAREATFRPVPDAGASANVTALPGRAPVGFDPKSGRIEIVESVDLGTRKIRPVAVAALFPPGWTRTRLPARCILHQVPF